MVKHTQTIRRQESINCLIVFDHFVGLALKGLTHFIPTTQLAFTCSKGTMKTAMYEICSMLTIKTLERRH